MFYVMSTIVPLKFNVESPKMKKEPQSNLPEKRKVKKSQMEKMDVCIFTMTYFNKKNKH